MGSEENERLKKVVDEFCDDIHSYDWGKVLIKRRYRLKQLPKNEFRVSTSAFCTFLPTIEIQKKLL